MLLRKIVAEALGTALLLAAVVGSGIMAEELARPNVALALLANTIATGAALVALIIAFGPISGAHFNPVVTLADASQGGLPWREVPGYIGAQIAGAFAGVAVAHVMFKQPALFFASQHRRDGIAQLTGVVRGWFPSPSARTSPRPTGSRRLHPSPTQPSRWPAPRATRSRAFAPPMPPGSSSPSSPAALPRRPSFAGWSLPYPKSPIGWSIGSDPTRSTHEYRGHRGDREHCDLCLHS